MKNWIKVFLGFLSYLFRKKTPSFAYHGMINLFCKTQGKSNDWFAKLHSLFVPRPPRMAVKSLLGDYSKDKIDQIVSSIEEKGYYVFDQALPSDLVDQMLTFSLTQQGLKRPSEQERQQGIGPKEEVFKRDHPTSIRFDFVEEDLINFLPIQKLMRDPLFFQVASSYLHVTPFMDVVAMWWHTSFTNRPDENAAQFYHFDMDRIKWLKFFFYLTDVSSENGPHCFVEGSHQTGGIPKHLLERGYARISDDEVSQNYPASKIKEFTGKRGSIIAVDTRGLHKGKVVEAGDRLLFQMQFSNSLFGTEEYNKVQLRERELFLQLDSDHKRLYSKYL